MRARFLIGVALLQTFADFTNIWNLEGEKNMFPAHNKQHFQKDLDVSNGLNKLDPNFYFLDLFCHRPELSNKYPV